METMTCIEAYSANLHVLCAKCGKVFHVSFSVVRMGSCSTFVLAQLHQIQSLDDHVQHQEAHFRKHHDHY